MLEILSKALFLALMASVTICAQRVEWVKDIKLAQQTARETGKPIMYDFTAPWCKPCEKMDSAFWPKPEVVEMSKQFVCVKVDFDRDTKLRSKYGINGIPNVVFTDPWGRGLSLQRGFGTATETQIFDKIKSFPHDFSPVRDAGNTLDTDEKNLDALYKMAAFYQERRFYWLGLDFLTQIVKLEADPVKRETTMLNLAYNYVRLGEYGDAIDEFKDLIKEYPKSAQADAFLYGLMFANIQKKKIGDAEKNLAELRLRFPDSKYVAQAEENLVNARAGKKK